MKNITQKILTSVTALTMIVGATSVVPPVQAGNNDWTARAQCGISHVSSEGKIEWQEGCTVSYKANENSTLVRMDGSIIMPLNIRKGTRPGFVTVDDIEGVWKFDRIGCGFQFANTNENGTTTYTVKGNCN